MKLTARRRAVLAAIVQLTEDAGAPPSLREIGDVVGLVSTDSVRRQVGALESAGLLRPRPVGRHRSHVLAEGVATSRNGLVALAVAVSHCSRCLLSLPDDHDCAKSRPEENVMPEPMPAEENITEVLAVTLTCYDTIVRDPDRPAEVVEWAVTGRGWAPNLAPTDRVLLVDYRTPDGTTGRHAFENPIQKVTVRVAGMFGAAA